jgi:hypothetical protein
VVIMGIGIGRNGGGFYWETGYTEGGSLWDVEGVEEREKK